MYLAQFNSFDKFDNIDKLIDKLKQKNKPNSFRV